MAKVSSRMKRSPKSGGHFGLLGMRERAERLGGELQLAQRARPGDRSTRDGAALVSPGADFAGMETPIRIVIAEDHLIARVGVKTIINTQPDMSVVGRGRQRRCRRMELYRKHLPDVTLMDVRMPILSGAQAIIAIRAESRGCPYHRA